MGQSKTERALIGTDASGIPIILATDGPWIANDIKEICSGAEDIGLTDSKECPTPGLYLWIGTGKVVNGGSWDEPFEPCIEYEGTIRRVQPDEVAELYAMKPPAGESH